MCESQVIFANNTPHCEKCLTSAFEWPADDAEFCDICAGKEYCEKTQTFKEMEIGADEAIWIKDILCCRACKDPVEAPVAIKEGWSGPCDCCCCGACGGKKEYSEDYGLFGCCGDFRDSDSDLDSDSDSGSESDLSSDSEAEGEQQEGEKKATEEPPNKKRKFEE